VTSGARPGITLLRDPVHLLAFGFGMGLSPWAPGTFGTLLALPLAWLMMDWPIGARIAVVASVILGGIWICGASARRLGVHDHPAIVLDEIAAMLLIALVLPKEPVWFALAFISFRFFDIVKPWPIRDIDHRLQGGIGIMLDDLMAAVYSIVCLWLISYLQIVA
jgi:phosphatidylglycerophosphatase A